MLVFCKEGQKDRAVDVKEVQIVKKRHGSKNIMPPNRNFEWQHVDNLRLFGAVEQINFLNRAKRNIAQ
jgi:hypothetical protein